MTLTDRIHADLVDQIHAAFISCSADNSCKETAVTETCEILGLRRCRHVIASALDEVGETFDFDTEEELAEMDEERRMDDELSSTMSFLRFSRC